MEEATRQKLQCSTADTRTKVGLGMMDVSQFKLNGPLSKDVSGLETKRSAMESYSSHSPGEWGQSQEELALLKRQIERDKELHLQIRKQAIKHEAHDLFEAFDICVDNFRKFKQGSSMLTDRASPQELFAKLRGELKAALSEEFVIQAQNSFSSSSSFIGSNQHQMLIQLQTIQQLRQHIDYLQGQLLDQQHFEIIEPKPKEVALTYLQSIKRSVLEDLHSPCYNTFDKDNCESFADFGSSAFNYYRENSQPDETVQKWNSCTKFVRQYSIKLEQKSPKQFLPASSTKHKFKNIIATYKRLFHMYLESLTTSWKLLLKLVSTVKKSVYERFVTNGKTLLQLIKEQLNRVTTWYGNLNIPVVGYTYCQLDQFTGICNSGLTELHQSREQIDRLLVHLTQRC